MPDRMRVLLIAALSVGCLAQEPPATGTAPPAKDPPTKAPKPKSRLKLLQQTQVDLDMAATRAKVDEKGRKKLDKCHEVLIDAIAQQQRFKSVNVGKINGCLNHVDKLDEAGAFAEVDRDKLRQDTEKLGETIGKSHRIRLPHPL